MSSRRTTLGPVSSSHMNSRASLGPQRVAQKASATPASARGANARMSLGGATARRMSMASQGNSRRSSIFGKAPTIKTDPRPVSDKSYINGCIKSLITYLAEHGYDKTISPKILSAPTKNDFMYIMAFLMRQIDPNYKFGPKPEDEVPALFKALRYPFGISKTSLHSVGSPHSWPPLLAALTWLVELLLYDEEVEKKDEAGDGSFGVDDSSMKLYFGYLTNAYQNFLAGDDDSCAVLDEQLEATFTQKNAAVTESIKTLTEENAQLKEKIAKMKGQASPLEQYTEKKKDLVADIDKFKKLISNLEKHKEDVAAKMHQRENELKLKEAELAEAMEEKADLQQRLDSQELSAADVERMNKERAMLEENLALMGKQKDEKEKGIWDLEMQMSKRLDEAERTVCRYHDMAAKLEIMPADRANAKGIEYEIVLNAKATRFNEMVNVDLASNIRPALLRLRDEFTEMAHKVQEEVIECQEKLDTLEEQKAELDTESRALEAKLKKGEQTYAAEKTSVQNRLDDLSTETEAMEERSRQLKTGAQKSVASSVRNLENLAQDYADLQKKCETERQLTNDRLVKALEMLTNHKSYIQENLSTLVLTFKQVLGNLEQDGKSI